jgi:hypothetical protein
MQLVKSNPYRIVGLLVGATAKEQERQIRRLKQFIEAEQEPQDDYSFPALGNTIRTVEDVTDAATQLNLDSDKMNASLFWFYNGNTITDESAFNALKDGNLDKAISILEEQTSTTDVTQANASAYSNLATLYLSQASDVNILKKGILLKLKFLESDFSSDFKIVATDENYNVSNKELQLSFLHQIQAEIEIDATINANDFLDLINNNTFLAKQDFLKDFVQKPIEFLERKIEEIRVLQKADHTKAGEYGNELYETTKPILASILSTLGKSDIQAISISDKVASEILECSINLFNHFHETKTEVGEIALELNDKAKSIALGSVIRERIEENNPLIEQYVKERPRRVKQELIEADYEALNKLFKDYNNENKTLENAEQLLTNAKPFLLNVKNTLGPEDDLYSFLCINFAAAALNNCIEVVNENQDIVRNSHGEYARKHAITKLTEKVNYAYNITDTIRIMDLSLSEEFRSTLTINANAILNVKGQIGKHVNNNDGCYIATMVYGNYDHPQVLILRQFRDDVLSKSKIGKWFIKTYYFYSPKMVEKLQHNKTINTFIRKILNQIVKLVK